MKKFTIGIFANREDAEKAINELHTTLSIDEDDISYLYKNTEGEVHEVSPDAITSDTPVEGAQQGAAIGGTIGVLAGIAAVAGVIPVVGPLLAAGPLAAALGLGAVGTAVAGAATGVVAGGLIGALVNIGVGEENAQRYADRVHAGDVLVSTYADEEKDVHQLFINAGALETEAYGLRV